MTAMLSRTPRRLSTRHLVQIAITAIVSAGVVMTITAAGLAQGAGETIICKPTGSESDWREGVVMENNPNYSYIRVQCGPAKNGNPGGIFLVDRKDVHKAGDVEAQQKAAAADPQQQHGGLAVAQSVVCLPTGSERDVRTGKILENNPLYDFVRVECPAGPDGRPGGIFLVARKDIRSPNAVNPAAATPTTTPAPTMTPAAAVGGTTAPQAAQPATTSVIGGTADKGNCACPAQTQANGNSVEDNIKRTIIARYVRNGGALDTDHTPSTVHFDSFQLVKQRPYRMPIPGAYHTGSPDGPGGKMGTQVYEVLCKYTVCIDYPGYAPSGYRGRIEMVDHDAGYTCFIDTQGGWRCNQSKDQMNIKSVNK